MVERKVCEIMVTSWWDRGGLPGSTNARLEYYDPSRPSNLEKRCWAKNSRRSTPVKTIDLMLPLSDTFVLGAVESAN